MKRSSSSLLVAHLAVAAIALMASTSTAAGQYVDIRESPGFFLPTAVLEKVDVTEATFFSDSRHGCTGGQSWWQVVHEVKRADAKGDSGDVERFGARDDYKSVAPNWQYVYKGGSRPDANGNRSQLLVFKPFSPLEPSLRKERDVTDENKLFEKLPYLELPCAQTPTTDASLQAVRRAIAKALNRPEWARDAGSPLTLEFGKDAQTASVAYAAAAVAAISARVPDDYRAYFGGSATYRSSQESHSWKGETCSLVLQTYSAKGEWTVRAYIGGESPKSCKTAVAGATSAKADGPPATPVPQPTAPKPSSTPAPASAASATASANGSAACTLSVEDFRQVYARQRLLQVAALQMTSRMAIRAGLQLASRSGHWMNVWEDASPKQRSGLLNAVLATTLETGNTIAKKMQTHASRTMGSESRTLCAPASVLAEYPDADDYLEVEGLFISNSILFAIDGALDLRAAIRGSGGIDRHQARVRSQAAGLPPFPFAIDELNKAFSVAVLGSFMSEEGDNGHFILSAREVKEQQALWHSFRRDSKSFFYSDERHRLTASVVNKVEPFIAAVYPADERYAVYEQMEKVVNGLFEAFEREVNQK